MNTKIEAWRELATKDPARVPNSLQVSLRMACDRIEALEAEVRHLSIGSPETALDMKALRERNEALEKELAENAGRLVMGGSCRAAYPALEARLAAAERVITFCGSKPNVGCVDEFISALEAWRKAKGET